MTKQIKSKGFTIVELLIVIVVIAILAAITIVAYNGIQQRAHTTAQKTTAENLAKKVEAYNAINNAYPVYHTTNDAATQLNADPSSSLGSSISLLSADPGSGSSDTQATLYLCSGTGTAIANNGVAAGYQIKIYDRTISTPAAVVVQSGGTVTGCVIST